MKIVIVDFGAPSVKKIASFLKSKKIKTIIFNPCKDNIIPKCNGIILSGGPDSVCKKNHLKLKNENNNILDDPRIPTLGICYGAQLLCKYNGGIVKKCNLRDCFENIKVDRRHKLYKGLDSNKINVKFRHSDYILKVPKEFTITSYGYNKNQKIIYSFYNKEKNIYGVQYHPEIINKELKEYHGGIILNNFLDICFVNH